MSLSQARLNFISIMLIALFSGSITFYGFFLSTTKIPNESTVNLLTNTTTDPWFERKTKVVLLVVDALRFDYFHYNESIEGQEQYPYQNRFKKIHKLFKENPENAVTIRTYSDPPTWTVQRTRCLATGSNPPYIVVAQSLGASQVVEDNIFREVKRAGGQSYAIGDPLWPELFHDEIVNGFASHSMNLMDFESEKQVAKITYDAVKRDEYDIVVGHRLGADHVGHFFGTNVDPRISEQLSQNDDLAMNIIKAMDEDTILFILGDHGMREDGNHGGTSEDETSTVIAAYCKKGFRKYQNKDLDSIMKSLDEKPGTSMMQVNLAPTLAMLLGVPIPFSNLGQIINDFYPNDNSASSFKAQLLRDNYLNTLQIHNFLVTFQKEFNFFSESVMNSLVDMFNEIQEEYQTVSNSDQQAPDFKEKVVQLVSKMQAFSEKNYELAKTTSFYDNFMVIVGGIMSVISAIALVLLSIRVNISQNDPKTSEDQQEWSLKKSLKESVTDKFLYCVLAGAVLVGIFSRTKIIHVLSGALFVLLIKAFGLFVHDVYHVYKRASSSAVRESPLGKINIELGSIFLPEDPERGTQEKAEVQVQEQTHTQISSKVHKILSSIFKNTCTQVTLALFAMVSVISYVNTPYYGWAMLRMNDEIIQGYPLTSFAMTLLYLTIRYVTKPIHRVIALILIVAFSETVRIFSPPIPWPVVQPQLALFMFGYFVYSRVKGLQSTYSKVSIKYFHLATFCAIWFYFTFKPLQLHFNDIYGPRVALGSVLISCFGGCVLARRSILQNLQLCAVELLFLIQQHDAILSFALLICMLRFTNFFFKKLNYESYAYPVWVAAQTFVGYFMTGHSDRLLGSIKFAQGFVGLNAYNAVLSPVMIFMNTFASFILGMIFLMYYRQSLRVKKGGFVIQVDEEDTLEQVEENSASQPGQEQSVSDHVESSVSQDYKQDKLNFLKVRNSMVFVLFFSAAFLTTVYKCYDGRENFLRMTEGNEAFMLDGTMYLLTFASAIPLMF